MPESMDDQQKQQIDSFFGLLDEVGLSDERKAYWATRFAAPDFSDEDEQAFLDEIEEYAAGLDEDIGFLEAESDGLEARKAEILAEIGPDLQKMAPEVGPAMDEDVAAYEQGVLSDERAADDEIEKLRTGGEADEIAKLREQLGKNE